MKMPTNIRTVLRRLQQTLSFSTYLSIYNSSWIIDVDSSTSHRWTTNSPTSHWIQQRVTDCFRPPMQQSEKAAEMQITTLADVYCGVFFLAVVSGAR